jgi:flagellar protein FliO/FliZ
VIVLAARAALVAVALAALVVLVRRRGRPAAATSPVVVVARAPLGPGLGLAVVETGGRRLLVGWGRDGVRLVRDLGAPEARP